MLAGINTALVTPFDTDLEFDPDAMRRSVRHQIACGTAGLCALGGTGEPLSLSLEEHRRVIDTVVEETAGRVPVTVGCLLGGAADVTAAARHAQAAGADAVMLVPPYFYAARPFDIERHFQAVAGACSLPVIMFHTPGRSGVRLAPHELLSMIHVNPAIRGIKDASGDLVLAAEVIRDAPDGFCFMQGLDELLLASLALGAAGGIVSLGELLPRSLRRLYHRATTGDLQRARQIQFDLLGLCRAIYREPNPGPLKYALDRAGRPAGPCRAPIHGPGDDTRSALDALLPGLLAVENAGPA